VTVAGAPTTKPSRLVDPSEPIVVAGAPDRFVSRGGHKLDAALDRFAIEVAGRRAFDAGASTGGFTDCLLQRGASTVIALDVGYGQLHERLRGDPRVDARERVNLRHLDPMTIDPPVSVVVADLSFISLGLVAAPLLAVAAPGADVVVLVKPQFEAGRTEASRGRGVIRDPVVWRRVLDEVIAAFRSRGASIMGVMVSPIRGSDGNVEFLLHARAPGGAAEARDVDVDLDGVVAEASRGDR
jgi:23S rRNA (cytidine1920-2'-O)/16S rRNA (cytidine1409-2'-O)-methyltransferase